MARVNRPDAIAKACDRVDRILMEARRRQLDPLKTIEAAIRAHDARESRRQAKESKDHAVHELRQAAG